MTQIDSVRVSAPSRLHFGLLSFGHSDSRQYGGLGAMIDRPRVVLNVRRAESLAASGPLSDRALAFAGRVLHYLERQGASVHIEIREAPRPHVGLGTGTQLALAVARALFALFGRDGGDATDLAIAAGRGQRSAIGTHGFARGGLIFERGKQPHEQIAPLAERVEIPNTWRFVLLIPGESQGLSGQPERDAFSCLPAVPMETTQELCRIAREEILPAAGRAEFDAFSDALYRYGHLAGMCFAPRQSGAFATRETENTINALRAAGIQGVGQSSWGPTVFALVQDHKSDEALQLCKSLVAGANSQVLLTSPSNAGAIVEFNV